METSDADVAPLDAADIARVAALLARPDRRPPPLPPAEAKGRHVTLVPLEPAVHAAALHAVTCGAPFDLGDGHRRCDAYDSDALVFRYLWIGPFADASALETAVSGIAAAADTTAVAVQDGATGTVVGMATLMSHQPAHLKVEIGHVWYGPVAQGTACNTETVYLLLRHCFETVGYRRVEWKCDAANARSRRAALRLGFVFEGIQQWHLVVKGRNRDTAWFRIIRPEWPAVRARLEATIL